MRKKIPGKVLMTRQGMFVSKVKLKGHKTFVLKVHLGNDRHQREMITREKVALFILKGLAVPKEILLTHKNAAKLISEKNFCHIATELIPWKGCFGRKFTASQSVALWVFTIEQLCAFHRREILYTDLKHNHLRVADDLSGAMIIDFDGCVMVEKDGLYPTEYLTYTGELFPPEFHFLNNQTERFMVYQVGMLLGSFLLQYFHNNHTTSENLEKIKNLLKKEETEEIYNCFASCISKSVESRPQDLETLFTTVEKIKLSPAAYQIWSTLRAPYAEELEKLGFKTPNLNQTHFLKSA